MSAPATIIYTQTDEAPALATHSLLPIIQTYCAVSGIEVELRDISLAGRIIAAFPECLAPAQRGPDALAELGRKTQDPLANIIKLPNISASVPQMKAAISELQQKGYDLPDYPDEPADEREADIKARYDRIKGSAVNPVLREGNSDRRAPPAVKAYARKHPHSMGAWSADSASHVCSMSGGDFFGNEQSATVEQACSLRIEHRAADGGTSVLKEGIPVSAGEVVDASFMSCQALGKFLAESVAAARAEGVLFSLHLKATMMKVSDPIIFGHAVRVYFADLFDKHEALFDELGVDVKRFRRPARAHRRVAGRTQAGDRGRHRTRLRRAAAHGHGRLRPRHHQSACAERHHHRRFHARGAALLGQDVGAGRQVARHESSHS